MATGKDNYTRKRDLQAEVMALVDGSREQPYIVVEVLKMIISEIKSREEKPETIPDTS